MKDYIIRLNNKETIEIIIASLKQIIQYDIYPRVSHLMRSKRIHHKYYDIVYDSIHHYASIQDSQNSEVKLLEECGLINQVFESAIPQELYTMMDLMRIDNPYLTCYSIPIYTASILEKAEQYLKELK